MFSIPQNILNISNNLIFSKINEKLKSIVYDFISFSFLCFDKNKYIKNIISFHKSLFEIGKSLLINIINELDRDFKNSKERKSKWLVNKSKVPRTITTIFGSIYFERTLYIIE